MDILKTLPLPCNVAWFKNGPYCIIRTLQNHFQNRIAFSYLRHALERAWFFHFSFVILLLNSERVNSLCQNWNRSFWNFFIMTKSSRRQVGCCVKETCNLFWFRGHSKTTLTSKGGDYQNVKLTTITKALVPQLPRFVSTATKRRWKRSEEAA